MKDIWSPPQKNTLKAATRGPCCFLWIMEMGRVWSANYWSMLFPVCNWIAPLGQKLVLYSYSTNRQPLWGNPAVVRILTFQLCHIHAIRCWLLFVPVMPQRGYLFVDNTGNLFRCAPAGLSYWAYNGCEWSRSWRKGVACGKTSRASLRLPPSPRKWRLGGDRRLIKRGDL